MKDRSSFFYFPEFPEGTMGLKRGSILKANLDIPHLGITRGFRFPLGFDGEYIRCTNLSWSIEKIEDEIQRGIWTITGEVSDLSSPERARHFIEKIEQRQAMVVC